MVYGIVTEFNPFHNGHKLLIDKVKSKENYIISVTSTSFVQRGDVSLINKIDKTSAAIQNGVDLVLELPAVYSLTSGEIFAKSAINILESTGVVEKLIFGSECGNVELLKKAADAFDSLKFQEIIKSHMNSGEYYPKAVSNSAKELFSDEMASIFDGANNILGIEYIKALKGTNITPVTFSREGSNHDSNIVSSNIASGSYIREHFNDRNSFMPDYKITDTANIEEIEKIIIYKFSQMTLDEIKNTPDVIEGFENRISEKVQENSSFTELCNSLKTKRYTMARIRRILCCGLLGITKEIRNIPVPYIRVLGFSQKGEKLLKEISKTASLPLITNVKKGYDNLDKTGKKVLDIEILATKLWSLASNHTNLSNDFKQKIIK